MKIVLEHIFRKYPTASKNVLEDVSLTIGSNETLAITGPSGCGKSTLLNIIGTLDKPDSGTVSVNDQDIKSLNEAETAAIRNKKIGFVFQLHHLLPQLNLLDNILLPSLVLKDKSLNATAVSRGMELLQTVGLTDKIRQYPGQLSVGECQRAALVRALINQPELILADEPTGSLDQESAEHVGILLLSIHQMYKVSLVVVTHAPQLASKMNTVYSLQNGHLINS
ncbi:MAG TPA: ABC transporter ATP-binding protein [Saprospiraceae bacterium]|nr:ABC transporter ATP-binding protein [Saprospiraceae bacterium]